MQHEYTAKDTPQQKHLAESDFTTVTASARAMMHHACLLLCKEAFQTTSTLDDLTMIDIDDGFFDRAYDRIIVRLSGTC